MSNRTVAQRIKERAVMNVNLMGKNLADEHYRPSQSTRSRPREFLLSFSLSF